MSVITRGAKNAFRNGIRTGSIVLILAISIGLALSMLLANQAVRQRINEVKTQLGNTIVVRPAGSLGMQGGGEPLKDGDIAKVKDVAHVTDANAMVNFAVQTEGKATGNFMLRGASGATPGKTNLESSVEPGTLGHRFNPQGGQGADPLPALPIRGIGSNVLLDEGGKPIKLTEGRLLTPKDGEVALVGKDLAVKNNLKVGSTFTAYDKTFTVAGIFDTGTKFGNDTIRIPLAIAQQLTGLSGEVAVIVAQIDSIDNMDAATSAIKSALGSDHADVTSTQADAQAAISGLKSVESISFAGFIVALAAGAMVVFLTMLMVVRERRREIGVLKAIGGTNLTIVSQFVVESLVLVSLGAAVGLGMTLIAGDTITKTLVSTNTPQVADGTGAPGHGDGPRIVRIEGGAQDIKGLVGEVTAVIGVQTLGYGVLVTLLIAILGSAIPAWIIAKVRPAEVLRGE